MWKRKWVKVIVWGIRNALRITPSACITTWTPAMSSRQQALSSTTAATATSTHTAGAPQHVYISCRTPCHAPLPTHQAAGPPRPPPCPSPIPPPCPAPSTPPAATSTWFPPHACQPTSWLPPALCPLHTSLQDNLHSRRRRRRCRRRRRLVPWKAGPRVGQRTRRLKHTPRLPLHLTLQSTR